MVALGGIAFKSPPATKLKPLATISSNIVSTTNYGGNYFCSSIEKENIFAVQFHPEKSGKDGLKMYLNIKQKLKIE